MVIFRQAKALARFIMAVHRSVLFGALLVTVCATGAQQKGVKETAPPRATTVPGKQTYVHYCASCHGPDARGDGPAAIVLKTSPPDLTTLAKRHGGKFPYEYPQQSPTPIYNKTIL